MMIPVESELTGNDQDEFRNLFKELSSKVDSITMGLKNGSRLDCNDLAFDVIEKLVPYLKGSIKNIIFYRKSRQIQIAA